MDNGLSDCIDGNSIPIFSVQRILAPIESTHLVI